MDIEKWINNINKLELNFDLKNNIISFFKEFGNKLSFSFIPITDKQTINAFHNVNNYKPLSICLDIEFQSAIVINNKYIYETNIKNDNVAKFIRELGMLFFIRDQKLNIYYIGHIFINFKSLCDFGFNIDDIKLIGVKYATVTSKIHDKMYDMEKLFHIESLTDTLNDEILFKNHTKYSKEVDKIINLLSKNYLFVNLLKKRSQYNIIGLLKNLKDTNDFNEIQHKLKSIRKQLNNTQYEVYAKYLNKTDKIIFSQLNELYWNDEFVRKRVELIDGKYEKFMDLFSVLSTESVFVLKGKMDIIALKNMNMLINNKNNLTLNHYYDIETFNGFSNAHFKSSQLENTYNGLIQTTTYQQSETKLLFDEIIVNIGNKAHNPVVDSLFTIVVAIIINMGLNNYFGEIDYYAKYLKYKSKYTSLKDKNI